MRVADETMVQDNDAEVLGDEQDDEFALYYTNEKVYIYFCILFVYL